MAGKVSQEGVWGAHGVGEAPGPQVLWTPPATHLAGQWIGVNSFLLSSTAPAVSGSEDVVATEAGLSWPEGDLHHVSHQSFTEEPRDLTTF